MKFWVVSPNVGKKADEWEQLILRRHVAVMGWGSSHQIGKRFIGIDPGDVVLIARRHSGKPDIVALGEVRGDAVLGTDRGRRRLSIRGVKAPTRFGSFRNLFPFVRYREPRERIPFIDVLRHTKALVELHPEESPNHQKVCVWMGQLLSKSARGKLAGGTTLREEASQSPAGDARIVSIPRTHHPDYSYKSKQKVQRAKKQEAGLVRDYGDWIRKKYGHGLYAIRFFGKLQCDCFDKGRGNLIEAKSSASREDIRMAVGQLLDYYFCCGRRFGKLNMGILLPKEPRLKTVNWLAPLNIKLVWRDGDTFQDNANGRFK